MPWQPLKHKLYPGYVTLCIAAACRDANEDPCIVLCADTRLDYGELGSTNTAIKIDILGHGWCVQSAGDWGNVGHWKDQLITKIQTPRAATIEQVGKCLSESVEYFKQSVFCEAGRSYQLLLSGFPKGDPVILSAHLTATESGHALSVSLSESFGCIGSGATIAHSLLTARECWGRMPLEYVAYLAYEAKRSSEKTGSVGSTTVLFVQSRGDGDSIDSARVGPLSEYGKQQLEAYFHGLWKVPVVTFPKFPAEYFEVEEDSKDPQSTKGDLSNPPPLPESPEGSDGS